MAHAATVCTSSTVSGGPGRGQSFGMPRRRSAACLLAATPRARRSLARRTQAGHSQCAQQRPVVGHRSGPRNVQLPPRRVGAPQVPFAGGKSCEVEPLGLAPAWGVPGVGSLGALASPLGVVTLVLPWCYGPRLVSALCRAPSRFAWQTAGLAGLSVVGAARSAAPRGHGQAATHGLQCYRWAGGRTPYVGCPANLPIAAWGGRLPVPNPAFRPRMANRPAGWPCWAATTSRPCTQDHGPTTASGSP